MATITYQSCEWEYILCKKKAILTLPVQSGVYLIADGTPENFSTLYVGSCSNIRRRLKYHPKIVLAKTKYKNILILYNLMPTGYLEKERDIIAFGKSEFNVIHNSDYNSTNCSVEDYNKFLFELKIVLDGRRKNWVALKIGIKPSDFCLKITRKYNTRKAYFTKAEISKINEVFKSTLYLPNINEKLKAV